MIREYKLLPHPVVQHLLVSLLVLFSFFMSALVSRTVFEHLPHLEDEVAYLYQAKIFERGQLTVKTPHPRRSYWQPFVVDFAPTGQRFGKYTPGWPLLLSIGTRLGQPWVINAFLSALSVALVYRVGREIFNPDVGLVAAALTAFSPMALLLNGTLMGHTAALFFATLFVFAYWRVEHRRSGVNRWAVVAGFGLGMVAISRPLTAVGVALPFILWSGARLLVTLLRERDRFLPVLRPLIVLTGVGLLVVTAIPIFNNATTGDPIFNLYTLVWDYDRVGFGECCGRNGHTLERGIRHTRFDLSLLAADLYGWQLGAMTPELQDHLRLNSDYWPVTGISWILLPSGLLIALARGRHKTSGSKARLAFAGFWLLLATGWIVLPLVLSAETVQQPGFAWFWLQGAVLWLLVAFLYLLLDRQPQTIHWGWLLFAIPLCLVGAHLMYWIGSQRYSTRYYFEALPALSIISALPVVWLGRRVGRRLVYGALGGLLLWTLYTYSMPRISALYHFNTINQEVIDAVERRRTGDAPLLVIVSAPATGDDRLRWRAHGSLMAVTSPFLDSEIVVAWDYLDEGVREAILDRFPDRQVIEMIARGNDAWFVDEID